MKRLQSLDIIKGIAILGVFLVHYYGTFSGAAGPWAFGQMGCQLFFVASGFGVALSYGRIYGTPGAVKRHLTKRYKAIAPAFWIMLVLTYVINSVLLATRGTTLRFGRNTSLLGLVCNALMIHGFIPLYNNSVGAAGGWYIGTTVILYWLFPVLFVLLKKWRWVAFSVISVLSIGSFFAAAAVFPGIVSFLIVNNSFLYFSFPNQLPCFCLGIMLYFTAYEGSRANAAKPTVLSRMVWLAAGIMLFGLSFWMFYNEGRYTFVIIPTLMGGFAYCILRLMLSREQQKPFCGIAASVLAKLGQKSYYIFLSHGYFAWTLSAAIKDLIQQAGVDLNITLQFFLVFPVVFFFAYLSALVLEKAAAYLTAVLSRMQKRLSRTWSAVRRVVIEYIR